MRRRAVLLRDGGGRLQAGHLAGQGAGTASPPAARPRPTSTATRPSGRPVPFASAAAPWRVRAVLAVTPRLPPTPPLRPRRVEDLQRPVAQRPRCSRFAFIRCADRVHTWSVVSISAHCAAPPPAAGPAPRSPRLATPRPEARSRWPAMSSACSVQAVFVTSMLGTELPHAPCRRESESEATASWPPEAVCFQHPVQTR